MISMIIIVILVFFNYLRTIVIASAKDGYYDFYEVRYNDTEKPWMSLYKVNNLLNTEVAVFIISTTNEQGLGLVFLRSRVLAGADTWMKMFANVFVIVEDNFDVRYAMRQCELSEYYHYTTFKCKGEPTYILSRRCTNIYFHADGPCCKVDDIFNFLVNDRPNFFFNIKFALVADDDEYIRADQVLRWLSTVEDSGLNSFPIIANPYKLETPLGGWYQPIMINHAALSKMKVSSKQYGLTSVCKAFDVSQDVGFGPYAWMLGLNHIQMPGASSAGGKGVLAFENYWMAYHGLKPDKKDKCNQPQNWHPNYRYKQKYVMGCRSPLHNLKVNNKTKATFYDIHAMFENNSANAKLFNNWVNALVTLKNSENELVTSPVTKITKAKSFEKGLRIKQILFSDGLSKDPSVHQKENPSKLPPTKPDSNGYYKGDKVYNIVIPRISHLYGYGMTNHSKVNDIQKKWVDFTFADCDPPGRRFYDTTLHTNYKNRRNKNKKRKRHNSN